MKNPFIFIALALVITLIACNNAASSHADHAAKETQTPATTEAMPSGNHADAQVVKVAFNDVDAKAIAHIKQVLAHYFHIKDALVAANTADAKSGADALVQEIKGFDKSLLTMKQKEVYDAHLPSIQQAATDIAATDQLAQQRTHFEVLSNHVYELTKSFGSGQTIYQDHCPMAFDGKGANWLSTSKEIRNPYFGDEMLTCGKVTEIIE